MLPGHFRMPFGEFQGYSLARLVTFHTEYVKTLLDSTDFQAEYPSLVEYFSAEIEKPGAMPVEDFKALSPRQKSEFLDTLEDAELGDVPEPEPDPIFAARLAKEEKESKKRKARGRRD